MRGVKIWVSAMVIGVLAVGCGGGSEEATETKAAVRGSEDAEVVIDMGEIFRGHLVYGRERQSFKACGTNRTSWVVDLTGGELESVYERLAINPHDPIFVEVRGQIGPAPSEGFGADYDYQLTVLQLRRASLEGPGCDEDLRTTEFRARGNEPFWDIDISKRGIVFSDFGRSQKLVFPYVEASVSSGRWHYVSTTQGAESHRIEIAINEQSCADNMSGAYFSFVAKVKLDGRTYSGCATEGWQ